MSDPQSLNACEGKIARMDGINLGVNCSLVTEPHPECHQDENCGDSKVVVQILPSVDLNSISALAEFNVLSGISVKSKGMKNCCKSDIFERLSSSGHWSSEESIFNLSGVSNDIPKQTSLQTNRTKQVSKRSLKKRKPFNGFSGTYSIYPGNGMKLLDIKHIASELANSSAQVIRILHYLLFGVYGLIANESLLQRTRQNILQFSGFSFAEDSDMYVKKKKALLNLPYPLLVCIHRILINSSPVSRSDAVVSLLQFLQKPADEHFNKEMPDKLQKELTENEIKKLKSDALEAHPVVLLERLNENLAEKMKLRNEELIDEADLKNQTFSENYPKPSFIHCGTGLHLKYFPEIANNIWRARRRIVNLLHSLLYGRPGSDIINRQNILEFNGFTSSQKNFIARKMAFLKRLRAQELTQLCDVFSLRVKTRNRSKTIRKLLQFLANPHELNPHKNSCNTIRVPDNPSVKIRDFDAICSKVECSTPDYLSELNDLLFVKPCDNSEIHQKILDFTSFSFDVNSIDFHYRKTLMHYMDMKTIRKIAELLDIENWENCRNHHDLSQNILNFLMNMKLPDKKRKSAADLKNKRLKCRPNIMMLYSSEDLAKSRSCSPENFDSTYASEELNENDRDLKLQMPCYRNTVSQTSAFYHQLKNGMFSRQEHVLNDSTPLFEFIQHPTDKELYSKIDKIISTSPLSITLGDLVKEVFKCYPNFNLQYRTDFIRNKALEILQELRESISIFPD